MAVESKIEWTDATFNPWMGCTKVSPACDHCYAEVSTPSRRFGIKWGAGQPRQRTSEANWRQPVLWNAREFAQCADCGWRGEWPATLEGSLGACPSCIEGALVLARRRVFCASLADVFDKEVDPQWLGDLWELIRATPNLDWLLLTKRIGRVRNITGTLSPSAWPRNVWLGISVVNQEEANRDIPKLLEMPAAVRFLSMEPLLGPVDLTKIMRREGGTMSRDPEVRCRGDEEWTFCDNALTGFRAHKCGGTTDRRDALDWVIAGGESGHHARPMNPQWVRDLRDQCAAAKVPFLFKQWGEWMPAEQVPAHVDGAGRHYGTGADMRHVGKKAAGRTLDGVLHTEYPVQRA